MERHHFFGAGGNMRANRRRQAPLEMHELTNRWTVLDRCSALVSKANPPALAVAGEHDRYAHIRGALHPLTMLARAEPGKTEREEPGMRGSDLESHAIVAVERRVLIRHHRLRRTLPRSHGIGIDAGDGARR